MGILDDLMQKTNKIDFLFPNSFEELMNNKYYDYDKFEWFLYYVFKLDGNIVEKIGKKGKGDGGADLIVTQTRSSGTVTRVGIQAKYWKNRVGSEPINQLASAKTRHSLGDLWIITTSDLTSDAKEIAERMDIKILRKQDVMNLINTIKKIYEKDISEKGSSSIEFLKRESEAKKENTTNKNVRKNAEILSEHVALMKKLRKTLSKKHDLYPLYNVYNNDAMHALIEKKPTTLKELSTIKGFGQKRIDLLGEEIISFIKTNLVKKTETIEDENLFDFLMAERTKIAKFNSMQASDVYSVQTAKNIVKMKPKSKETLKKVFGFNPKNIDIFGDYLVRKISIFLSKKHNNTT